MGDTVDTGENLGAIFKILQDANAQAAQSTPYAGSLEMLKQAEAGPLNPLNRNPYTGELVASPGMAGLSGLVTGAMQGLGQHFQDKAVADQNAKARDTLMGALQGQDVQMPDGMNPSVFNNIKNAASIFQMEKAAQVQAAQQAQQKEALGIYLKDNPDAAGEFYKTGKLPDGVSMTNNPRVTALLDAYKITDPATRGALRTPEQVQDYVLHGPEARSKEEGDKLATRLGREWEQGPQKALDVIVPVKLAADNLSKLDTPISAVMLSETVQRLMTPQAQVVRAGVLDKIEAATSPYHHLAGKWNEFLGGSPLDPTTTKQFLQVISQVADEKLKYYKTRADDVIKTVNKHGGDGSTAITSYDSMFGDQSSGVDAKQPSNAITGPDGKKYIFTD